MEEKETIVSEFEKQNEQNVRPGGYDFGQSVIDNDVRIHLEDEDHYRKKDKRKCCSE